MDIDGILLNCSDSFGDQGCSINCENQLSIVANDLDCCFSNAMAAAQQQVWLNPAESIGSWWL